MRSSAVNRKLLALFALAGMALASCNGAVIPESSPDTVPRTTARSAPTLPTTTTPAAVDPAADTTTTSTTATTLPLGVTTTTAAPPPGLGRGATGPEVQALEEKLAALRYEVGKVDGSFDAMTGHGVMAFQKAEGLNRTGRATDDVIAKLAEAQPQAAMLAEGGADRVEIDLKRQVLLLFKGGQLERVLNTSTGNNKRYCVDGQCATAVTPGGSFRVGRKIKGLRVSRLGQLHNPLYFNGGIAIHGSPSVPAYPASHGCVRIPMGSSLWFHETVPAGTPVYVIGGKTAPVPFNEQAPTDDPASTTTAPATTTTTATDPAVTVPPLIATTTTTTVPTTTTAPTTTTTPAPVTPP